MEKDLPEVNRIYEEIHTEEENGTVSIGWIRGIYPTAATAEQALHKGDLFVEDDSGIVGAAIINQQQVDSYRNAK